MGRDHAENGRDHDPKRQSILDLRVSCQVLATWREAQGRNGSLMRDDDLTF